MGVAKTSLTPPPPAVEYTRVLAGGDSPSLRSLTGVMAALLGYALVVPLAAQLFVWVAWQLEGRPGDHSAYARRAMAFELPAGMAAVHLALGLLIAIAVVVSLAIHRMHPRWLLSVQPGVRWRFLVINLLVAAVVLNAALWLSRSGTPWNPQPQADAWIFLVVIVLTSPLQAMGEEFLFRGYLLQAFGAMVRTPWFAIVTSAVIFAALHGAQNPALFLDRLGFGILAGVLVARTGGLEAAIAAHVVNNIFAFGYAALESSVAQVKAVQEVGWIDAAFDVGGFAAFTLAALLIGRKLQVATTTPEGLPARSV